MKVTRFEGCETCRRILELMGIAEGKTTGDLSVALGIPQNTVTGHMTHHLVADGLVANWVFKRKGRRVMGYMVKAGFDLSIAIESNTLTGINLSDVRITRITSNRPAQIGLVDENSGFLTVGTVGTSQIGILPDYSLIHGS